MTPRVTLHYSRELDATAWQHRHERGEVPDRWPYGLHRLGELGPTRTAPVRRALPLRALRTLAGGYDWHRLIDRGEVAVCWDERAGVPVALSGVPTLTGVIWLSERGGRHWTDPLARRALARSSMFVLSHLQVADLSQDWGLPASRVHFVPFGVDADFWQPSDGTRDGVLIVGNDRHRDHPTAVRAAHLAGCRSTLVTAQDVPVSRVHHMSHSELREAYADHAAVAIATLPNRHASGLTVALEAMACSRPVVATEGCGLEDYITPDVGALVPAGDDEAMASELRTLLADPDRAAAMGQAGRAAVEARYNTDALARSLHDLTRTL